VAILPVVLGVRPERLINEEDISFDVDIGVLGDLNLLRNLARASGSSDERCGVGRGVSSRTFYNGKRHSV
jgi:hypothetical protein